MDAVALVCELLAVPVVKLDEPDHYEKIIEALQVCANVLLPADAARYTSICDSACSKWPLLLSRLQAVRKQETGSCAVQ